MIEMETRCHGCSRSCKGDGDHRSDTRSQGQILFGCRHQMFDRTASGDQGRQSTLPQRQDQKVDHLLQKPAVVLKSFFLPRNAAWAFFASCSRSALSFGWPTRWVRTVFVFLAASAARFAGFTVNPAFAFVLTKPFS